MPTYRKRHQRTGLDNCYVYYTILNFIIIYDSEIVILRYQLLARLFCGRLCVIPCNCLCLWGVWSWEKYCVKGGWDVVSCSTQTWTVATQLTRSSAALDNGHTWIIARPHHEMPYTHKQERNIKTTKARKYIQYSDEVWSSSVICNTTPAWVNVSTYTFDWILQQCRTRR